MPKGQKLYNFTFVFTMIIKSPFTTFWYVKHFQLCKKKLFVTLFNKNLLYSSDKSFNISFDFLINITLCREDFLKPKLELF